MIKFSISLFFICIFYCTYSQTPGDFILANEVVHGKVLKIYQATAEIPPGDSPENPKIAKFKIGKIVDFNSQGQYVTIREIIPDGYELLRTEYSYNAGSKPISGKISTGQIRAVSNLSFSYDSKGNLSEIRATDAKDNILLQEQRYDYKKGYLEITQNDYGKIPAHYRHRVENGKLMESILLDTSGKTIETTVRKYNTNGILEQTVKKDAAGQEINRVTFTYEFDEKGNWTKEVSHDQQTDKYKFRTQSIVYQGEKAGIPTEKELQGLWYGWMNKEALFVLDGKHAMLKTDKKKIENHTFKYNMLSGEFSLSDVFSITASFTAWFDGKVLILRQSSPDRTLYFTKNDSENNSTAEPAFYEYSQKPETEFISFLEGKLRGIKTKNENVLLKAEYEDAYRANSQLIKAKKNGKWALFNSKGKQLTEFQFQEVSREVGDYLVCIDSIKVLFAPDGKKILEGAYEKIKITNSKVVWVIHHKNWSEERHGIFDLSGNVILPIEYRLIKFLDKTGEAGAIAVSDKESNKTIWFDKNFKEIRTFPGQVGITPLGGHFFMLQSRQLRGMLDLSGNTVIEPVYEELRFISAHLLAAKRAGKFGLIDINGKEVTHFNYDNILSENLKKEAPADIEFDIAQHRSAALFVRDGDFGYLNGYGKEVKPMLLPLNINQQLLKTFELPGLVKFSYPYKWKQLADFLQSGDETGQAIIRVKSVTYSGELPAWLQKNYPDKGWLPQEIDHKPAYSSIEIKKVHTGVWQEETRSQKLFIPVNDDTALELSFDCTTFFYPHLAQDFFHVVNSLKSR
jgi:hypothetical protein